MLRLRSERAAAASLGRTHEEQQAALERRFGDINGWVLSERQFPPTAIGRRSAPKFPMMAAPISRASEFWFDHALYYRSRETRLCAAIVGQPYNGLDAEHRAKLDLCAARRGLAWHVSPMPYASLWYPGWTIFIVMTMPGVTVNWLPEQMSETLFAEKGAWARQEWGIAS
jgi:hypothetical protein